MALVVDFPLFEYDATERRWAARHHPFTSPKDEHIQDLLNGNEAAFVDFKSKKHMTLFATDTKLAVGVFDFQTPVKGHVQGLRYE